MTTESAALAIEAAGLVRVLGGAQVVDGLDLRIPVGGVHGLLGCRGAGKTTTLRLLAGALRPDGGSARILGLDIATEAATVRARVGFPGRAGLLHTDLTAAENLLRLARLLDYSRAGARTRADQLLTALGLLEASGRPVATYPEPLRRRLALAASIVVRPELVLLDEPTAGLDAAGRGQVEEVVRALARAGTTVLLATRSPTVAALLADGVWILESGRVVARCTPGALRAAAGDPA